MRTATLTLHFMGKLVSQKTHGPRICNMRTKDVHKKTFIFGSIWKNGKTSELEFLMKVPMRDVLRTSFSRPSFFFFYPPSLGNFLIYVMCYQLAKIEKKNYKYKYQFPKFPIINCIFAQKNLSFFAVI